MEMSTETPTEHPHITRNPAICGGSPRIRNSRITVRLIAEMWQGGDSVDDIVKTYPHLQPSWVYDAVSYYLDHKEEIEQEIEENRVENVLSKHGGDMDQKGVIRFPSDIVGNDQ
jgi:uncharacterized protein (DUF433 family)